MKGAIPGGLGGSVLPLNSVAVRVAVNAYEAPVSVLGDDLVSRSRNSYNSEGFAIRGHCDATVGGDQAE